MKYISEFLLNFWQHTVEYYNFDNPAVRYCSLALIILAGAQAWSFWGQRQKIIKTGSALGISHLYFSTNLAYFILLMFYGFIGNHLYSLAIIADGLSGLTVLGVVNALNKFRLIRVNRLYGWLETASGALILGLVLVLILCLAPDKAIVIQTVGLLMGIPALMQIWKLYRLSRLAKSNQPTVTNSFNIWIVVVYLLWQITWLIYVQQTHDAGLKPIKIASIVILTIIILVYIYANMAVKYSALRKKFNGQKPN